jgi:hypothetical protein
MMKIDNTSNLSIILVVDITTFKFIEKEKYLLLQIFILWDLTKPSFPIQSIV